MIDRYEDRVNHGGRVLMFSQRNIYEQEAFRCPLYEFEEIVRQIDSVELVAPTPQKWFRALKNNAMRFGKYSGAVLNPGLRRIKVDKYYDLFVAICQFPGEILHLAAVEGWKDKCKNSICIIDEFWTSEFQLYKGSLRVLSKFDIVLVSCSQSVKHLSEITKANCLYGPLGVDAILFCPYPKIARRVIDILSIGRRGEKTHQAILKRARENKTFYMFDTMKGLHVSHLGEHRSLLADIAKRSRYFFVNPGRIDRPKEVGDQSETGSRYYEGAAAGAILIGEEPRNQHFKKEFHWPDAVIELPYNSGNVCEVIEDLDGQPERRKEIRKNNVINSLLQHDWVYRWEKVLEICGLDPLPQLLARKKRLRDLSIMVEKAVLGWVSLTLLLRELLHRLPPNMQILPQQLLPLN